MRKKTEIAILHHWMQPYGRALDIEHVKIFFFKKTYREISSGMRSQAYAYAYAYAYAAPLLSQEPVSRVMVSVLFC